MLNVKTKVIVGSKDSVATVWITEHVFPVTPDFNISTLILGHYNETTEVGAMLYIFYLNSSGAYLLYEGDGNGSPTVLYDDKSKTWHLGFDFGESNPALEAFLGSLGHDVNESKLKNSYLAFNGSCLWVSPKQDVKGRDWSIVSEAQRKGNSFFTNFTVSYVDPAYGASWADYSWRIPAGDITKLLGNLTSITMASQRLINCTKGKLEGEEYCFPIDPKVVYVYPDNLQIFMLPEKDGLRYMVTHLQVGKKTYNILLNTTDLGRIPSYNVFQYNLNKNTTRAFSLLKFLDIFPYTKLSGSVGFFNPPLCESSRVNFYTNTTVSRTLKKPVAAPRTSKPTGNEVWVGFIGVCIGLILGILLTRKQK